MGTLTVHPSSPYSGKIKKIVCKSLTSTCGVCAQRDRDQTSPSFNAELNDGVWGIKLTVKSDVKMDKQWPSKRKESLSRYHLLPTNDQSATIELIRHL